VAHVYNPNYSEGRNRRIVVQSQPRQIVPRDPVLKKKPLRKRVDGVAQGVGLEFKPQYYKKKKKKERKKRN
jgi:hypothetical protein